MRVRLRAALLLCACICVPLAVHWWEWRRTVSITHSPPDFTRGTSTKLILTWVPFFGDPYFTFGEGQRAFVEHGCAVNDCAITDNRLQVPQHEFDALMFHSFEFYDVFFGKPRHRSPHQRYVFMALESSLHTPVSERFRYFFNTTLTYRLDSDVPWPYFVVIDRMSGERIAPALQVDWRQPHPPPLERADWQYTMAQIRGKAQPARAAWFVSNCNSDSGREALAEELGQHMPVDVYGGCGQYACPSATQSNCTQLLAEKYHFYLAFENSLCEDYITEKVLHALEAGVVPVIYSGAQLARFLPPRSYVSAHDKTPEQLALRLKRLAAQPERYASYLWWRDYYRVEHTLPSNKRRLRSGMHPLCTLCALLHSPPNSDARELDIITWWTGTEFSPTCVQRD